MNSTQIDNTRDLLYSWLRKGNLLNVIERISEGGDVIVPSSELDEIMFSYGKLLSFYETGVVDPHTKGILDNIVETLCSIVDDWYDREGVKADRKELRFRSLREYSDVKISDLAKQYKACCAQYAMACLEAPKMAYPAEMVQLQKSLFHHIWSQKPNSDSIAVIRQMVVEDVDMRKEDRTLFVYALLLSLINRFSASYMSILLDLLGEPDEKIRARALVAVTMVTIVHGWRIEYNPQIKERLIATMSTTPMRNEMLTSIMNVMIGPQALVIKDSVNNEIVPRLNDGLNNITKIDGTDISNDDWMEVSAEDLGIDKAIRRMAKWQMQGADVFFPTVSSLKSFPFFRDINNWFLPFDTKYPDIQKIISSLPSIVCDMMSSFASQKWALCDSDKYSMLLGLMQIPADRRDKVSEVYMMELSKDMEIHESDDDTTPIVYEIRHCVHDLFRFFYIHPRRNEFVNPFSMLESYVGSELFRRLVTDKDLVEMADYCVDRDSWRLGQVMYEKLVANRADDIELHKKTIYCLMKDERYVEALSLLRWIESLGDKSSWAKKKMSLCYRALGDVRSEIECLVSLYESNSDDMSVLHKIALGYMRLHKYEEALRYLFEIDYKKPNEADRHCIAHCCLMVGKIEQALSYVQKAESPGVDTYVVGGCAMFASGQRTEGLKMLLEGSKRALTPDEFNDEFDKYIDKMHSYGMTDVDVVLIKDMGYVKYKE